MYSRTTTMDTTFPKVVARRGREIILSSIAKTTDYFVSIEMRSRTRVLAEHTNKDKDGYVGN